MKLKNLFLLGILSFYFLSVQANDAKKYLNKFGKVTTAELSMTEYEHDKDAPGVVLFDKGSIEIAGRGQLYKRHLRIKVLRKEGLKLGDFEIVLSKGDRIGGFRAFTFNLSGGEITKQKLNSSTKFEEKSDYLIINKYKFPGVQVGSVIDIKYEVEIRNIIELERWYFQREIPVMWSEIEVSTPSYLEYLPDLKGDWEFAERKIDDVIYESQNIKLYKFGKAFVDRFRKDVYLNSSFNYKSSISFELKDVITNINLTWLKLSNTWKDLGTNMMKGDMGDVIFKSEKTEAKEYINELSLMYSDESDKMIKAQKVFEKIQKDFEFNGRHSITTRDDLKKLIETSEGNSAELAFIYIAVLNKMSIKSKPVLISTRKNGYAHNGIPSITKYNHVLVQIINGDETALVDISDEICPFGILPVKDLNFQGRAFELEDIEEGREYSKVSDWVMLSPMEKISTKNVVQLTIVDGKLNGSVQSKIRGYDAAHLKKELNENGNESTTINDFFKPNEEFELSETKLSIENAKAVTSFQFIHENGVEELDDLMLVSFQPFLEWTESPFVNETRDYDIDLAYPINQKSVVSLDIPEGYAVEALPEMSRINLSGGKASFILMTKQQENSIQIVLKLAVKETMFTPEEYLDFKSFVEQVVRKTQEQIILKKI